ncbi:MAG: proline racemase family protein [Synergistales bacterium]|nr:proline racemase family protein [Synergistales bacterium]
MRGRGGDDADLDGACEGDGSDGEEKKRHEGDTGQSFGHDARSLLHEGVTGSLFTGSVSVGPKVGGFETVLPLVRGRSWVTGFNFLVRQPQDDVGPGFLLKR